MKGCTNLDVDLDVDVDVDLDLDLNRDAARLTYSGRTSPKVLAELFFTRDTY